MFFVPILISLLVLIISILVHIFFKKRLQKYNFELELVNKLLIVLEEQKNLINLHQNDVRNKYAIKFLTFNIAGPLQYIFKEDFDTSDLIESIPVLKIIKAIYDYNTDNQVIMLRNISIELDIKIQKLYPLKKIKNRTGIYSFIALMSLCMIIYSIELVWLIIIIFIFFKLVYDHFKAVCDVLADEDIQALKKYIEEDFF